MICQTLPLPGSIQMRGVFAVPRRVVVPRLRENKNGVVPIFSEGGMTPLPVAALGFRRDYAAGDVHRGSRRMPDDAAITPAALEPWMAEHAFDIDGLAEALGAHYTTVRKWLHGLSPVTTQIWLALQYVALDRNAYRRRVQNRDLGLPTGSGFTRPLVEMRPTAEGETAMLPEEFVAWMDEYAFTLPMLSAALGVHRQSLLKWRAGKHPMRAFTRLALYWLERDKRALRARQRVQADFDGAYSQMVSSRQRAREATLTGTS